MKNFYLTFTLLFAGTLTGFGQIPVITTANNFAIGENHVQYEADTTNVRPGASGANVTWDFSNLKPISPKDSDVSKFVSVASTPYPNDFPTADLATASIDGQSYTYISYQNSTYTIVGEESEEDSNGQAVEIKHTFDKPEVLYTFPITYLENQSSSYESHFNVQGGTEYIKGTLNLKGDAYGTLKIMNKTYPNVLRVYAATNEIDSLVGAPFSLLVFVESWSYITPGKKDNILTITDFGPGSAPTVTYNINDTTSTSGIESVANETNNVTVFPNPAKQSCRVSFSSATVSHSDIRILNQLGQDVKDMENFSLQVGENDFDLDLNGLVNGIYFIQINSGNGIQVQKLIVG